MWYESAAMYQIYPFGFFGAPNENDGQPQNRINKLENWIEHLQKLKAGAVYFCPVFESDRHGYDTRDYTKIDCRLGTNQDFANICKQLHDAGIRVVLDGVFNHVGRGFWAFQDLREKKKQSQYVDWFILDFGRDSNYQDGFWYEGWEGHYELVKLNLKNPQVVDYLLNCVNGWIQEFDIDGLRLDVAYMLDENFIRRLHSFVKPIKQDFVLIGEIIHGDYNRIVNPEMLDSCTNYECYKGIYSSLNDNNLFEIAYSLNRQFGPEQWTLYKGMTLLNFVDNHDVSRFATVLKNQNQLKAGYGLLFGMPGVPCLYYGSEWAATGEKTPGNDDALRPCFEKPEWNELTSYIAQLCRIKAENPALSQGGYRQLSVANQQLVFAREHQGQTILVGVNIGDSPCTVDVPYHEKRVTNLLDDTCIDCEGKLTIPAFSAIFWRVGEP